MMISFNIIESLRKNKLNVKEFYIISTNGLWISTLYVYLYIKSIFSSSFPRKQFHLFQFWSVYCKRNKKRANFPRLFFYVYIYNEISHLQKETERQRGRERQWEQFRFHWISIWQRATTCCNTSLGLGRSSNWLLIVRLAAWQSRTILDRWTDGLAWTEG